MVVCPSSRPDRFELRERRAAGDSSALKSKVPQLKSYLKGFPDLQSNIAIARRRARSRATCRRLPDEYRRSSRRLACWQLMHGTAVAGIAVASNPYARLVVGRIEFDWHLIPDPCPTRRAALRDAKNTQSYVDFFAAACVW
jgi:hypothetical protein